MQLKSAVCMYISTYVYGRACHYKIATMTIHQHYHACSASADSNACQGSLPFVLLTGPHRELATSYLCSYTRNTCDNLRLLSADQVEGVGARVNSSCV